MAKTGRYDIIIAGAGASGLSLVWHILQSQKLQDKQILLADRQFSISNDRTWCFWDDTHMPFDNLIHHSWNQLEVVARSNRMQEHLVRYRYHCIRSLDYRSHILSLAHASPNITLLETDILDFKTDGGNAVMETGDGEYRASYIFQSVMNPPGFENEKTDISLKQQFLGWEIKTVQPIFNPDKAVFMDFDVLQKSGVTFFYTLPFSDNTALVEYTQFSSMLQSVEGFEEGLKNYLRSKMNLSEKDYTIIRKETGVIPMEDRHYPATYCEHVFNIGTSGGLTKPSTGYTFTRIHRHSAAIVSSLENSTSMPEQKRSTYRFRVYDIMLLYLLDNDVDMSVTIFHNLFEKNRFDRILQFLEEETHFGQELAIFSSLPPLPFLKSIWKMRHRIFTGA